MSEVEATLAVRTNTKEREMQYERAGIRIFKSILPSSGEMISKAATKFLGKETLLPQSDLDFGVLIAIARIAKFSHVAAMSVMEAVAIQQLIAGAPEYALGTTIFNAVLNVYPIMLQNYQLLRLQRIRKIRANRAIVDSTD
jgi:hypothetical protein